MVENARLTRHPALTMLSIAETVTEMVNWVFPEHAGAPGQIHGGRMMQWIATCGTMAASRVARGNVVLGAMDDIDFLHPVKVGQVAVLRAQVEYVGRSSLEVGVRVYAENATTGERAVTLSTPISSSSSVDERRQAACRCRQASMPRGAARRRCRRRRRRSGAPAGSRLARAARARDEAGGRRTEEIALAVRVVALGAAGGRAVRQHDVPGQDADGHRRGGRHPLDALLQGPRHDGLPGRAATSTRRSGRTRW